MYWGTLIGTLALVTSIAAPAASELAPPPTLAEESEIAVRLSFAEPTSSSEIYREIGDASGIEVVFGSRFTERQVVIEIDTSSTSEALNLVSAAAGDLWVPTIGNAIIVADDTPQNHREYQPLVVQTFVLENGSVHEADKMLRSIAGVSRLAANEDLRTVTVREPASTIGIIEHLIAQVDHAPGEIDVRIELLHLSEAPKAHTPPARFDGEAYAHWRRVAGTEVLADSTLGLLGNRHANLRLGAVQDSHLDLDLRLDGRVHPESNEVSLEARLMISSTGPRKPDGERPRSNQGRIETSARLSNGSTLLLRIPGSEVEGIAVAITPTIVRSPKFDPSDLSALWVGSETRIQALR
jgi:type II secretory pathway component GspD/PulD (secretin)